MAGTAPTQNNRETDAEIIITRTFDAPRTKVWRAWTDPQQIVKWWGPDGFTNTLHEMDVRPGGVWRHTMHGPDGTDYPNKVVYREIVEPELIVYGHGDAAGAPACQFQVTVTFEESRPGSTIVTLRMLFETPALRDETADAGAIAGGEQTFARLAQHLQNI